MNAGAFGWPLAADPSNTSPGTLNPYPNILMIMVDQLRLPQYWLTSAQQATVDTICPNIAWLRQNSYRFWNFYAAAQQCTPSRATLLTGLYAPQTGMFATGVEVPDLNAGFPTFGSALQDIAGYAADNIMWFGKWHLSNNGSGYNHGTDTLPNYGFNSGRSGQILWPSYYGSPNGTANEGNNGYLYDPPSQPAGTAPTYSCDESIVNDFANNWTHNAPSSPWFACVSFVNPHDMTWYPGFFPPTQTNTYGNDDQGPQGVPGDSSGEKPVANFQPGSSNYEIAPLLSALPTGFNWESTQFLRDKSWNYAASAQDESNFLQPYFQQDIADATANLDPAQAPQNEPVLPAGQYIDFLNWYYYMISLADTNIGTVLSNAIPGFSTAGGNPSTGPAIIFLSDHGEFGGSHGLQNKGGAVYDEALRVPLYIVLPGQVGATDMFQMCSMVDVFRLVVELALGNDQHNWEGDQKYNDQYYNANQSLFDFIQTFIENIGDPAKQYAAEYRGFYDSAGTWYPFVLTTTDETFFDPTSWNGDSYPDCALRNHVMCMRTKSDANFTDFTSAYSGAKVAIYSKWVWDPTQYGLSNPYSTPLVDGTGSFVQDYEYYDYANYQNRTEVSYTPTGGSPSGSDYPLAFNGEDAHGVSGSGAGAQALLTLMAGRPAVSGNPAVQGKFGNMQLLTSASPVAITPASGIVADILTRPLTGQNPTGTYLSTYTAEGIGAWYSWLQNYSGLAGKCSS